jgi:ATP-dependent phosphofructokinase / diphosphate-dependent phosphofructokinase
MPDITRLGVLTGGGDAPGLNAVIRAVVKSACNNGFECIGLQDSFAGLIEPNGWRPLEPRHVTGILRVGGTILGTSNRTDPFAYPVGNGERADRSPRVIEMFHELGLRALVVIGGDGTLAIAHKFCQKGLPLVGVPKTIDNDIVGTTSTFGFDSAVSFATEAIDRLHTTAEAHHRAIVVEVMGRYAGWIALSAGIGGGADAILVPEIPFDLERVAARIRERDRWGARFSIVVVAEGARPAGGRSMVKAPAAPGGGMERLGGIGAYVAEELERLTAKETRVVVLGHLQRGGAPTPADRVLALRFGAKAVDLVRDGQFGMMVANRPPDIVPVPLQDVVGRMKLVPLDNDLVATARAMGIGFGD